MSFTCPSCDRLNLETGKLRDDRNVAKPIHLGFRSVDLILAPTRWCPEMDGYVYANL
jgi:hypothetical protein